MPRQPGRHGDVLWPVGHRENHALGRSWRAILIGDDEHGWSDRGTFNFEGGCYAKTINLRPKPSRKSIATTPEIRTVIENMVYDEQTKNSILTTTA